MINVYSPTETDFSNNGYATLNPISAEVSIDINGAWVLNMTIPYDSESKYTYVVRNAIIRADMDCIREQSTKRQLFRIYDTKRNLSSMSVIAFPIGMEATYDAPIEELVISSCKGSVAAEALSDYVEENDGNTKYTLTSNVTKTGRSKFENTNLIAAISGSGDESFVNTWGGEVIYDNYNIKIREQVGDSSSASSLPISYGRNLTGLEHDVDISGVVTRVYPISGDGLRLNDYSDYDSEDHGESYVQSDNYDKYPYIRSAFVDTDYELIDTDEDSHTDTSDSTAEWSDTIYDVLYAKAEELWETALDDLTNTYCPDYIQELIDKKDTGIIAYTQARYAYSHKGWQSLIKSLVKQSMEWIKKESLDEDAWMSVSGWYYGTFNGLTWKNYPKSQYIYSYTYSKWYYFDEIGLMSTEEIPQETIDLLNTYSWHTDDTGSYYGDGVSGSGNYMTNAWIENQDGTHSWVGADGYWISTYDDSETWEWKEVSAWRYGTDSASRYACSRYVEIDKNYEWFGSDGFWHDYEKVPADEWGWYQVNDESSAYHGRWWYGSKKRYYAHNEYVYVTVDGVMQEWWYDSDGWYDADSSGDSDYGWHGSEASGYWFGEEDAATSDKNKYLHDCWRYIDGTYYWFDSNGYISNDATLAKQDWQWGDLVDEVTGKHWFGNPDESFNRVWLASQWMKIDGTWYYFDSYGYMETAADTLSRVRSWFSNVVFDAATDTISACLLEAYELLYDQMTEWVNAEFDAGLDSPAVSVTVDLVDLSKTTEYADFEDFEKICLGDTVRIRYPFLSDETYGYIEERVVGLTYDLIRQYNTRVSIGKTGETLSSIMQNTSLSGSDSGGTKLIAGDNVSISGGVISVSDAAGMVTGLQDATYNGVSLVKGNVAVLDDIGSAEHVELTQDEYDKITPDADTVYFVYDDDTEVLDPDYSYYKYGDNDEIVVRVYHEGEDDENIRWYFKGFEKTASDFAVPTELQAYVPTTFSGEYIMSMTFGTEESTTQTGWIGWHSQLSNTVIRTWTINKTTLLAGTFYAVVDLDGAAEQGNLYEDPYVYITKQVLRKIIYNGRTYADNSGNNDAAIVECTLDEYNALPSTKFSDGILYIVYSEGGEYLDPDYSYYTAENDTIVVRVYHEGETDQSIKWFFCGFTKTSADYTVPTSLNSYAPTTFSASGELTSYAFSDSGSVNNVGWIGWHSALGSYKIRTWIPTWYSTLAGTFYGVVDLDGVAIQQNLYEDPYIYLSDSNPTRRIFMNGKEYAKFNSLVGYLTTEQEIGTWIDGSTLYQKTVTTGGTVPTGATLIERTAMASTGYDTIKYIY